MPQTSRTGHPKPGPVDAKTTMRRVRTGCLTWIRHLKCDEQKPVCNRCEADGQKCDGYIHQRPRLAKKPRSSVLVTLQPRKPDSGLLQYRPIYSDILGTPMEKLFFHHMKNHTVKDMGRRSTLSKFWLDFALPFAHHSDAIRHALVALGAAHRAFLQPRSIPSDVDDLKRDNFIIVQYNCAIRYVKNAMAYPTSTNLQITLVCCLLFVCLENLRGRYDESIRHLRAGCRLLEPGVPLTIVAPPTESLLSIEDSFDRLCTIADMFRCLGHEFSRFMGFNVVSMVDLAYYSLHTRSSQERLATEQFSSIDEAHNQLRCLDIDQELRLLGCVEEPWANKENNPGVPKPWTFQDGEAAFRALHRRFNEWSTRLNNYTRNRRLIGATTIQEIHDTLELMVQKSILDAVLKGPSGIGREEAEQMITHVEVLMQASTRSEHPLFTFEGNIIPSLVFVCTFFKDINVRQKAVKLLRSFKRREGPWDSQQVADVFEAGLMAEEQGLEVGKPPNSPFIPFAQALSKIGVLSPAKVMTRLEFLRESGPVGNLLGVLDKNDSSVE